ncbi:biopolymer transport protein ExbB [Parabacteroides chinchillae]|uniref:Biopolymer transport protein ExbB n=1 Tax=Parabacteroides chinchillae TaxID=871327 RepID=A0A8G2F1Z9_9BACT|nr:biopolymer transport protein ExbB [Parabacteroides chinchillae]
MDNNPGNYFGTIYKGGFIVPIVITLFLTVLTLSVERLIAISKSKGKGNLFWFRPDYKKAIGSRQYRRSMPTV